MIQSADKKMRGFSMIEVLIAVLILAIGLLGVAALQLASMNSGQEGYFRTQATAIAEDYASRIKAGRQAMLKMRTGAGAVIWDTTGPMAAAQAYLGRYVASPLLCAAPPAAQCRTDEVDGAADTCTAAEMAAFEQWDICTQAAALLPGGVVRVNRVAGGLRLSIAVAWTATQAREDTGEADVVVNPLCANEFGFAAEMDCVVVEAIP